MCASVNAFLNQILSDVQHGSSEVYCCTACVLCNCILNVSVLENVTENFNTSTYWLSS